jgi:hypothetical protein
MINKKPKRQGAAKENKIIENILPKLQSYVF